VAVLGITLPGVAPAATWPVQFKVAVTPGANWPRSQVMVDPLIVQPAVQVTKVMPGWITSWTMTEGVLPPK
jgi:hypothetical protein